MYISVIFRRELRDFTLAERFFSKRFLAYLALLFLPVGLMAGFSYVAYTNPSVLAKISAFYPEPIAAFTPTIALMLYVCAAAGIVVTLIAIIHAGNFIAGEQARGTLLLLSSKPVRRWEIIIGKYLGFLTAFLPLISLAFGVMYLVIAAMGIGFASGTVFVGYLIYLLILGLVYTSLSTLFSSVTKNSLQAILGAFIFMVVWFTIDFILVYLPEKIMHAAKWFSLSFHINTISGYISGGEAILRMAHPAGTGFETFSLSLTFVILLILAPVLISIFMLGRRDIHER